MVTHPRGDHSVIRTTATFLFQLIDSHDNNTTMTASVYTPFYSSTKPADSLLKFASRTARRGGFQQTAETV